MNRTYAVIMAGGRGERLFPLSTPERPKQFLTLFGDRTMLQQTVDRILALVPTQNILIVTAREHISLVKEQLPDVPEGNIVGEPIGRGTAPCVGLAATIIHTKDPGGVMLALPADHLIENTLGFQELLRDAIDIAARGEHLLTFGIDPTRPETGYGYIHAPHPWESSSQVRRVDRFTEKPDLETARRFVHEGTYYWNSGMFVWRADRILTEIGKYLPDLSERLRGLRNHIGTPGLGEALEAEYPELPKVSIDRGVMERCTNALLIPAGAIGWSDVGGWEALRELLKRKEKPWGHEELWALNQHYAGKFLHINKGESLSLQYHATKDETVHVLKGKLRLRIGPSESNLRIRDMLPGESCPIPPETVHQMQAIEDCIIAEVSTPHLTDVVRLRDRYGRT